MYCINRIVNRYIVFVDSFIAITNAVIAIGRVATTSIGTYKSLVYSMYQLINTNNAANVDYNIREKQTKVQYWKTYLSKIIIQK